MPEMNFNLSGTLNVFRLLVKPSLCLPHATISTFNDLPIPVDKAFARPGRRVDIRAVVLDKDDCFAYPDTNEVYPAYKDHFAVLRAAYPGRRLLIVSNTAGSSSRDPRGTLASAVESSTGGVPVLRHAAQKPGCGAEVMAYFAAHPETGVSGPQHVAVVGDRLATDAAMANDMGAWAVWVRDGVAPAGQKSVFAKLDVRVGDWLMSRGYEPPEPESPF